MGEVAEDEKGTGADVGLLEGKVAFITGVARGQGRAHAVRLAKEGAAIVGIDICRQIPAVSYPMATPSDLDQTISEVDERGGRILARQADVRDRGQVQAVVDEGISQFGRLDVIIANAGISPAPGSGADQMEIWNELIAVNLTGVYHTVRSAAPALVKGGRGGSIVLISSTAGLKGMAGYGEGEGYVASKHGIVGLMRCFAKEFAVHAIRVNSVHPTGVETPMIMNEPIQRMFEANPDLRDEVSNLLPVPHVQPHDVAEAVLWLVSDAARYVTGIMLPVDAGLTVK